VLDIAVEAQVIADQLQQQGWCQRPQFLPAELATALLTDLLQRRAHFALAAIGRATERQQQLRERSDYTLWLDGSGAAQRDFLVLTDHIRRALNRQLFLGLSDYEAHYAHYAPGAFYRRHVDAFRTQRSQLPQRILSSVFYLNENWQPGDGGELVAWREEEEIARIVPSNGTAIFFLSTEIAHEVLPSRIDRYSIAGWFRSAATA
jgi:SM-20-related protein